MKIGPSIAALRAEVERLRGLLRDAEEHMDDDACANRIAAALAPTVQPTVAHTHEFRMSFQTGDLVCKCGATPDNSPADSACLCLPFKPYADCPVHGTAATVTAEPKP